MAVGAVNGASEKRSNPIIPLVTAGAGVAVGGKFIGEKINSDYLLSKGDEFKLSDKAQEALKPEQKTKITDVNEAIKSANSEAVNKKVAEFITGEAKDVDAEKYLGKPLEAFKADIEELKKATDPLTKEFTAAEGDAKKAAQAALDSHKAKITAAEAKAALVKEGKITKEALTGDITAALKKDAATKIDDALKAFGENLPKIFSRNKAIIGGIAGLVAGFIVAKIVAKKPNEA